MNQCSNFRTFLILLVCLGGAAGAAARRGDSERRFAIERLHGADYLCDPDNERITLQGALRDGLSPLDEFYDSLSKDLLRDKKHNKERRGPKIWDQWGKWSPCSVTCGIGKIVRWRHCVAGGCSPGEKEAQIKSCTLPAC